MDKQRLVDLEDSDLAGWRDLPVSKLLLAHLHSERQEAMEVSAAHLVAGDDRKAILASGYAAGLTSLWASLHPPIKPPPETEDEYVDPATIRRPKL